MSINLERFIAFSKPFIDGSKKVFETMVQSHITPGKPELKDGTISKGDVSSIIGLNGVVEKDGEEHEFKGQFVMSFPKETYLKIAGAMLMEEFTDIENEEIADVGAEITNMITGNAKKDLNSHGYKIGMAVPNTVMGVDHSIKYPPGVQIVVVPIESNHGQFFIELCYQDK